MKTAVVTDSNSGIFGDEARSLGIHVIPMPVIVDGRTYYENEDITHEQFYEALVGDRDVSSSQPSPGSLMDLWEMVLDDADEIIYIPMSSGLSGSCQTAIALSDDYDGKVQVADNHRISVSMRQSVLRAVKLAKEGLSAKEIKERLEAEGPKSVVYLTVETLKYFKRTGRVTPAAAALGELLNIKPVLVTRGDKFDTHAKVRGLHKAKAAMLEAVKKERETLFADVDDAGLAIGVASSCMDPEDAKAWHTMVQEYFPNIYTYYDPLSLSIACHTGPNACGMSISLMP